MRIGVDIGGTKAHAIAIDSDLRVVDEVEIPSGHGATQVLAQAREVITRLTGRVAQPLESVGIGIPGNVDFRTGVVSHAVNLGIDVLALADGVRDLVDGPVVVDNDVNAAALGAYHFLSDLPRSAAYLNVGTGLAAGIVIDGQVWHGHHNVVGEVGHVSLDPNGALCPCGQRGCLETVASGVAIAAHWHGDVSFSVGLSRGDPAALELRATVARGIADAIQILILIVGVERIVLGGGVIRNVPGIVDALVGVLDERASTSPFLDSLRMSGRLELEPTVRSVPALGAALLAID
jgi:glucokinase